MATLEVVAEEVADNLEEIATATRTLNTKLIGSFLTGSVVGCVVGLYFGHKLMKEKIRAEAFRESEEEVAQIREHYARKLMVTEAKPLAEEIIAERGYDRPLPAPVPGIVEPRPIQAEEDPDLEAEIDETPVWDYELELQQRLENPDNPYVIHQEEFYAKETGYRQVTFTYFARDHVMIDDEDKKRAIDRIVGENNLKFGHGSDDPDSVFIRNNALKLEIEITRLQKSYEEDVLGIDPDEEPDDEDD